MADRAGRKVPRPFEPPPWERAQPREPADTQAVQQVVGPEPALEVEEPTEGAGVEAMQGPRPGEVAAGPGVEARSGGSEASPVSEAAMLEMMAGLAAQESTNLRRVWQIGVVAAVALGALGLMLLVFGVIGLVRTAKAGAVGILAGAILVLFGIGMVAVATWMVVRTLKQRGVL